MEVPNLRALRERQLLTQEELAKAADVTAHTISNIERGRRASFATIKKLAKALGVNPSELLANGSSAS